jgi:hypothetical protein
VSDEHADILLVKLAISVRLSDMERGATDSDAAFTVVGTVIDRRVDGILRFPFCIPASVSKIGGRRREVSGTRRGTASPARAKLLNEAVLENRSHAVGQSSDKRTLLRVGRGQPVGLYAPLHWRGCCAARPSTARLLWVGSHRSPLLLSV